jgi:hypothetical protein
VGKNKRFGNHGNYGLVVQARKRERKREKVAEKALALAELAKVMPGEHEPRAMIVKLARPGTSKVAVQRPNKLEVGDEVYVGEGTIRETCTIREISARVVHAGGSASETEAKMPDEFVIFSGALARDWAVGTYITKVGYTPTVHGRGGEGRAAEAVALAVARPSIPNVSITAESSREGTLAAFGASRAGPTGPARAPMALTEAVAKGATVMKLSHYTGIEPGSTLLVEPGAVSEERVTVTGLGSVLVSPTRFAHPAGAPVAHTAPATAAAAAGMQEPPFPLAGGGDSGGGSGLAAAVAAKLGAGENAVLGGPGFETKTSAEEKAASKVAAEAEEPAGRTNLGPTSATASPPSSRSHGAGSHQDNLAVNEVDATATATDTDADADANAGTSARPLKKKKRRKRSSFKMVASLASIGSVDSVGAAAELDGAADTAVDGAADGAVDGAADTAADDGGDGSGAGSVSTSSGAGSVVVGVGTAAGAEAFVAAMERVKREHPANLAAKHFSRDYFDGLDGQGKLDLARCLEATVECPDFGPAHPHLSAESGSRPPTVLAGAAGHYDRFAAYFDPLIRELHGGVAPEVAHSTDWLVPDGSLSLKTVHLTVVSVGVETVRNVDGIPFGGQMTAAHRRQLEHILERGFATLNELPDFNGRYYSQTEGHPAYAGTAEWARLRSADGRRLEPADLAGEGGDARLASAGFGADWPTGRGCFLSADGQTVIEVGGEDHLRMACVQGGDEHGEAGGGGVAPSSLGQAFDKLRLLVDVLLGVDGLAMSESEKYGVVTSSPRHVGTAMRAHALVLLPALGSVGRVQAVVSPLGLEVHSLDRHEYPAGSGGDGSCCFKVSVTSRYGTSEAKEAAALLKGLEALSAAEEKAAHQPHSLPSITHPSREASLAGEGDPAKRRSTPLATVTPELLGAVAEAETGAREQANEEKRRKRRKKKEELAAARAAAAVADGAADPAAPSTEPLSWEQLEENVKMLATKPAALDGMWAQGGFDGEPATLAQLHTLITTHVDGRIGGLPQLNRAFQALIDAEEKRPTVERPEFYKILAGAYYFARLFELFPDAPDAAEKTLDLVGFKEAVGKLPLAETIVDVGAVFDAFESNDGGLVHFDDFAVWYIAKRNTAVFN